MFGRKLKDIDALDLSAIADAAAKRHGWSSDCVQSAENEYRKFLYLLMLCPKETRIPWDDDLDLFWHEHILHTEQYAIDCQKLFGRFIHHDPSISGRPIGQTGAKIETAWAYYRTFGRRPKDGSSWRLPTAASLAAIDNMIPAEAKRSSGSGGSCGSGGGGHGCGGHGCGGGGGH
jgi:hypothetical protein